MHGYEIRRRLRDGPGLFADSPSARSTRVCPGSSRPGRWRSPSLPGRRPWRRSPSPARSAASGPGCVPDGPGPPGPPSGRVRSTGSPTRDAPSSNASSTPRSRPAPMTRELRPPARLRPPSGPVRPPGPARAPSDPTDPSPRARPDPCRRRRPRRLHPLARRAQHGSNTARHRLARSAHRGRAPETGPTGRRQSNEGNRFMNKIRVAIAGVGNCAASLIQGVEYYRGADVGETVPDSCTWCSAATT